MKIIRIRLPAPTSPQPVSSRRHSFGYIRANFFERIFIRGRIAGGDTGLCEFEGWEPGPKHYRARFCITAKGGNVLRNRRPLQSKNRMSLFNLFR